LLEESSVQLFPHAVVWMSRLTHNFNAELRIMCMFFYNLCFIVEGHALCFVCLSCKLAYVCDCPDAGRVISGKKTIECGRHFILFLISNSIY
jgi:hypothetical protein